LTPLGEVRYKRAMNIAKESGHWYCRETGEPRFTIIGANGKERATTLRDARKHGYVPSVTTLMKEQAKPGIDRWIQRQVLMSALKIQRHDGETEVEYCERIMEDSREQGKAAAERGTELHGAIERAIIGQSTPSDIDQYGLHIRNVNNALLAIGIDMYGGTPERSFACKMGYGGKIDLSGDGFIVDFKSKDTIGDKAGKDLAYDEHAEQLSAYCMGLDKALLTTKLVNVFVGVNDGLVVVKEWDYDETVRAWNMFSAILDFWKAKNEL